MRGCEGAITDESIANGYLRIEPVALYSTPHGMACFVAALLPLRTQQPAYIDFTGFSALKYGTNDDDQQLVGVS